MVFRSVHGDAQIGKSLLQEAQALIRSLGQKGGSSILPVVGHDRVVPIEHSETMMVKLQELAATVRDEKLPQTSTSNIILQFYGNNRTDTLLHFTDQKGERVELVPAVHVRLIAEFRPCCHLKRL